MLGPIISENDPPFWRCLKLYRLCCILVCHSLVSRGERQDEETLSGRKRMDLIQTLCAMNPKEALFIRSLCVSICMGDTEW